MKIDYRRQTFEDILKKGLAKIRGQVLKGYKIHGPCTTRELAERTGISLWTVRPRTTELVDMGLIRCQGKPGPEGVYEAIPLPAARQKFEHNRQKALTPEQVEFPLGV